MKWIEEGIKRKIKDEKYNDKEEKNSMWIEKNGRETEEKEEKREKKGER